jgi:antitoxin ParD1/3/4
MATSTLNISLPETMREFVEQKIDQEGYGTISEYIRELIRVEQRKDAAQFDLLILEALKSGETSALTKSDINAARNAVLKRIRTRKKAK